jgi:hypothetical protein
LALAAGALDFAVGAAFDLAAGAAFERRALDLAVDSTGGRRRSSGPV